METLIVASIETLKRSNKKCGKEEVLHLVQESVDNDVTKEHFEELLDKLIKRHSVQIKLVGTRNCLSLPKGAQYSKSHKEFNESLRLNVNEELSKFKVSVIEEFDALKSSFLAEVHSFKKRHLISCGNDVLAVNSERLIKQLQEDITFLREQLKNKDEVIHSLLQQLAKRENVVVECNNVSSHETSDKIHCSLLSNHNKVQQNTTHEELLLDTSIIVNETDNVNPATENRNLTAKTGNGHQQNRKNNSEEEKDKKPNKELKKGKSVAISGGSMVKHLNGWEMSKKIKNCKVYVRSFPGAKVQCMEDYKKPSIRDKPDHFIIHVGTNDLNSEVSPKSIAESIVDLAMSLKTESNDVSVSNIILRTDNSLLNQKGCEVDSHLKVLCEERNLYLIDNTKKFRSHHLNKGKLHLNRKGSKLLNDKFIGQLSHVVN